MNVDKRLDRLRKAAPVLDYDEHSKIVLISDCHRSNGGGADNFAGNENLYRVALEHYERDGYTYIELGDGDELWEGRSFQDIAMQYHEVFAILSRMYEQGRFHMLYGNHDMVKRKPRWVEHNLYSYLNKHSDALTPLFPGIRVHEALRLRERGSGQEILLLHGHQVDFLNCDLWWLARFLVRHVWRPLELVGLRDPNNASNSHQRRMSVEGKLSRWAQKNGEVLVAGHTHRPVYPDPGQAPYFNDGSCVSPRRITALEIVGGAVTQVRWLVRTRTDGTLYVTRVQNCGPEALDAYLSEPE